MIFEKAIFAKNEYEKAQDKEKDIMNILSNKLDNIHVGQVVIESSRENDSRIKQNITITNVTGGTFQINVNSVDASNVEKLYYYVNGELVYEGTERSYRVMGLENNSEYKVIVLADKKDMTVRTGDGDNIRTWLACIGNTDELDMDQILANDTLYNNLINNEAANSYLEKSRGIILPAVCEFDNNILKRWILKPTNNVIYSTYYDYSWKADNVFDNNYSTGWCCRNSSTENQFLGLNFNNNVQVIGAMIITGSQQNHWRPKNVKLQYSDDNEAWQDASEIKTLLCNDNEQYLINTKNVEAHQYWRIYIIDSYATDYTEVRTIQFYGFNNN